jgi:hypothetical protein
MEIFSINPDISPSDRQGVIIETDNCTFRFPDMDEAIFHKNMTSSAIDLLEKNENTYVSKWSPGKVEFRRHVGDSIQIRYLITPEEIERGESLLDVTCIDTVSEREFVASVTRSANKYISKHGSKNTDIIDKIKNNIKFLNKYSNK